MSATATLRHPIFDPDSRYRRIRDTIRTHLKIRGYFHWMEFEATLGPKSPPEAPHESNGHSPDWTRLLSGAAHAAFRVVATRLGRGLCFDGTVEAFTPAFLLVREADGSRSASLVACGEGFPPLSERGKCRAFLVESGGVIEHMASTLDCPYEEALESGFAPESAPGNERLTRLLTAIPDFDETEGSDDRVLRFQRMPIMDGPDAFPPNQGPLTVVLVFAGPESVS